MNKFFISLFLILAVCSITVTASDWTSSISGLNLYIYEGMNFTYDPPYLYFDDGVVYFNDTALADYINDTNETIRVDDLFANVSKWNLAYDWGNHSAEGYQTIANDKDTNLTGADIVGYVGNFSLWDKDYNDLINTPTIVGDNESWNESYADTKYQTITNDKDTNLTGADIVGYVGNWSLDKPDYQTIANDKDTNLTKLNILSYVGNFSAWDKDYNDLINLPTIINDNQSWNETYADTLYADIGVAQDNATFNQTLTDILYRAETWNNFTGVPTATPSDGDTTHLSTAGQIYTWAMNLFNTYVLRSDIVSMVGNWSLDKPDYQTIVNDKDTNLTGADIVGYVGNWSLDKPDYQTIANDKDTNLTGADIVGYVGNWSLDKPDYQTITNDKDTNLTGADVVAFVGNWSLDKPNYQTIANDKDTNLTGADVVAFVGNFSLWDKDYNDLINLPTIINDNQSWNESYADTKYQTIANDKDTNLTGADIVGYVGNWSLDKILYQTIANDKDTNLTGADVVAFVGNFSLWDKDYNDLINLPTIINDNQSWNESYADTKYQTITNDKDTNLTGSDVVAFVGNWSLDKILYQTIANDKDTNLTGANIVAYVGNWTLDKILYQTITNDKDTNLTGTDVVSFVGNWSLDKPDYQTITNDKDTNLTGTDVVGYVGNWSLNKPNYQTIANDKDTNLTEANVEAMIFDNDNSLPFNMSNNNITNIDCLVGQNGGKICWI